MKKQLVFKFVIYLVLVHGPILLYAQSYFVHSTKATNITNHMTTLSHSTINGQANALLFITQRYGKYNNHQAGVWYNNGKWMIYNEDKAAMPKSTMFNIMVVKPSERAFMHKATSKNIRDNWTTINHPKCNNNPNAVILVTQNWKGTYNPKPIGVWYTGTKWAIFNQDRTPMPVGTNFNVLVLENSSKFNRGNVFTSKATPSTKTNSLGKYITSTGVKNIGATLIVTQNWKDRGPYNGHVESVWYDGQNWTVYNQDKKVIPDNAKFNIVSFDGAPSAITIASATRPINTIYAADGTPVIQFKYKKAGQTYNTECSAPKWLKDPTSKRYREIFAPACHVHDLDYQAPWQMAGFAGYSGKKISDNKFLQEMNKICKQRYNNIAEETYCKTVAVAWYEAVNHKGHDAFDNGQETAQRDIEAASVKKGGAIKFYNGAAYVARYTLTYQINGQTKRFETGNISAGRSKSYGLPAGSTNIYVKGEGKTGLVWEPWRTTFSQSYPTAISKCFKSKGTTLGQKWDTSCE